MARKAQDAALKYMIELEIDPAKDINGLFNRMEARFGKETARNLKKAYGEWVKCIELKKETKEAWDTLQNMRDASPELAVAYTGACEGDILRKQCSWILDHKESFGEKILFISSDRGIVACFLGRELPLSEITLLCETEGMAAIAKALCEKLGVENVKVACKEKDELPKESFDTVLSADTAIPHALPELADIDYLFILEQGQMRKEVYNAWAEELASYLKEGGRLISMEVMERNRDYLGWCFALNDNSLDIVTDSHREITVFDMEGVLNMQTMQAIKGGVKEESEILAFFGNTFINVLRIDIPKYVDIAAEVMIQICAKELLWGYMVYDMSGEKMGKLALYSSHADSSEMFYYQAMKGRPIELMRYPYSEKNIMIEQLEISAREGAQQGFRLSKIMFDMNGHEVMIN